VLILIFFVQYIFSNQTQIKFFIKTVHHNPIAHLTNNLLIIPSSSIFWW